MNEPIVYLNDRFVPASQAKLNIYDLGIVLGATLTEMTRTFRHQPFRAEDHVARLYRSLKFSGITVPFTPDEMLARTNELAEANCKLIGPHEDIGIVHFVTPGENALYAGSAGASGPLKPTICIHSFPLRLMQAHPLCRSLCCLCLNNKRCKSFCGACEQKMPSP